MAHVRQHSTLLISIILFTAARHASIAQVPEAARLSCALERHIYSSVWPRVLLGNYKSVYICQACMLWATFLAEPRPGEDDLGWSLFGHASEFSRRQAVPEHLDLPLFHPVRVAMEIGLNLSPPPAVPESCDPVVYARNCERTWLTCVIADRR
jgi:hypothetical protein